MSQPWTITVSQQGQVSLASGLDSQDGSVSLAAGSLALNPAPANAPTLQTLGPSNPSLQNVTTYPAPSLTLPAGVNTSVTAQGRVTLQVYANDSSGRDLFVQWAASGGNVSFPGPERMTWDATNQRWTSLWEWQPPLGALPNQTYNINCSLGDGVNATILPSATQNVNDAPLSTILYLDMNGPVATPLELWKINSDGSSPVRIGLYAANPGQSAGWGTIGLSRDGTKGVMCGNGAATVFSLTSGAVLSRWLPSAGSDNVDFASISPVGNQVIYADILGIENIQRVIVSDLKGGSQVQIPLTGNVEQVGQQDQPVSWSPDSTKVFFPTVNGSSPGQILNVATQTFTPVNTGSLVPLLAQWSPDNWIYFVAQNGGGLYRVQPDGTQLSGPITLPPGMASIGSFSMSPTGSKIAVFDTSGTIWTMNTDGSSPSALTTIAYSSWVSQLSWSE
jgi:hypothetical protein